MNDFNGSIHWRFAFVVWLLIQVSISTWLNPLPLLFASLLPDADHKNAPIGKFIPLWTIWKHRTFTHTIFAMYLFSLPFFVVSIKWGISFLLGYYTHLALDSGTVSGVKWLGKKPRKYSLAVMIVSLMFLI